jgi:hypothetical protein
VGISIRLPIGTFPLSFDGFTLYWKYYQAIRHTTPEASEFPTSPASAVVGKLRLSLDVGYTTLRIAAISA